jgi:hypothetical protein
MPDSYQIIDNHARILLSFNSDRYQRFLAAKSIAMIARELHHSMIGDAPERAMQEPTRERIRYLVDNIVTNSSLHLKGDLIELEAATAMVQDILDCDYGDWN